MQILIKLLLLLVLPLIAVFLLLDWYVGNERYVTTDNAYVKADIVAVSASVDGRVVAISATENTRVEQGQELFRLDDRAPKIAVQRARAHLKSVSNDIDTLRALHAEIVTDIANAKQRVKFLVSERKREQNLRNQGLGTAAKIAEMDFAVLEAEQVVAAGLQRAQRALVELGGSIDLPYDKHPSYLEAYAALQDAKLLLNYNVVSAPAAGTVARLTLQPGEWLEAGEPVFSIIKSDHLWVEMNLKETQLTHIKIGQAVEFVVDAYPGVKWQGKVESISSATGSEFMLLPAQNATGNWVKVVQRLPVRVAIESKPGAPQMRVGMTVEASIDTRRKVELWPFLKEAVAATSGL
ncbi:MAG: membrane fusion protein (multidrug efflux system) [Planctomycetota bacterium]|jgi:membrane fusion protein (multidrug efflux system)